MTLSVLFFCTLTTIVSLTKCTSISSKLLSDSDLTGGYSNWIPLVTTKSVIATNNEAYCFNASMYVFPKAVQQEILIETECASGTKEYFEDSGFQLHQPNTPSHGESNFLVSTVEHAFNNKWNNFIEMKKTASSVEDLTYEPFFDHNIALYVTDIHANIERVLFQDHAKAPNPKLPYQFLKWSLDTPLDNKQSFLSLLVYIPNTQIIYELVSEYTDDLYEKYLTNELILETEARVTFEAYEAIGNEFYPWNQNYDVVPIRQGRAVSNVEVNVAWYVTYLGAELITKDTKTVNGQQVSYAYVSLPFGIGFEIGFYERPPSDTFGGMTQIDYENGINSVHKDLVVSYNCVYDRWFDNHYAIGMLSYNDDFKSIFNHILNSNQRFVLFNFPKDNADAVAYQAFETADIDYIWFLMLIEPNGNTIELTGFVENDDLFDTTNAFDSSFCPSCTDADLFDTDWKNNGHAMLQELEYHKNDYNIFSEAHKNYGNYEDSSNNKSNSKSNGIHIPKFYAIVAASIVLVIIGSVIYLKIVRTIEQHKSNGLRNKKDGELTPLMSSSTYGTV